MARPTKSHFAIYEDNVSQTNGDGDVSRHGDAGEEHDIKATELECQEYDSISTIDYGPQHGSIAEKSQHEDDEEAANVRRESNVTTSTVSSYPGSYYWTENDETNPIHQSFTPPIIRTRFRRAESVRRMQMTSPPPHGYRSPRHSILSNPRSRTGTPRSVRSVHARGSTKAKKRLSDEDDDAEEKQYPLVLLHVSLLPLNAPWNIQCLQEILDANQLENLLLLRSKLSDTMLQRGILIPHPKEEYELLEERLLEALELTEERITKCGHFHTRHSRGSDASTIQSGHDSDSGIGSSTESSDEEVCAICREYVKPSKAGLGPRNKKWTVKVFAANGLMRSSAWAAAWSDMERVDVEILPWISDEIRQRLDRRRNQEEDEECERLHNDESKTRAIVEEQVCIALHERAKAESRNRELQLQLFRSDSHASTIEMPPEERIIEPATSTSSHDLPEVYRRSQIPISILLKNYLLLLAQDRRNIAILILSAVVLLLAVSRITPAATDARVIRMDAISHGDHKVSDVSTGIQGGPIEMTINDLPGMPVVTATPFSDDEMEQAFADRQDFDVIESVPIIDSENAVHEAENQSNMPDEDVIPPDFEEIFEMEGFLGDVD